MISVIWRILLKVCAPIWKQAMAVRNMQSAVGPSLPVVTDSVGMSWENVHGTIAVPNKKIFCKFCKRIKSQVLKYVHIGFSSVFIHIVLT
jgi:hypothetical protein